jgi:DNA invertase Pin-like site-specific DNA recombinase/transposase-like protein
MAYHPGAHKIQTERLALLALIYIRQSTWTQVLNNTGSKARQYDLVQLALDLGWPQEHIVVIDQDQGQSGASATERDGFQSLVAKVGLGQAGAVVSLEASRLARSSSDWYRLIEICALTHTLVIDEEGVYDPSDYNDRLLLGFKGTMSEAELHWLRNRLQGGRREKAHAGTLRLRLPTGFVYDSTGKVVLDPDEQVQQAIRLVFDLFDELGSAMAVLQHLAAHNLQIPTRTWASDRHGELTWGSASSTRVLSILHNPAYAGAYVYGRTQKRHQALPGEPLQVKHRNRWVKREDWEVVRHSAYPGYITWEQFLRNQQRLDDNRTFRPQERHGVAREGSALLQGIVLCGRCGRRMAVYYRSGDGIPHYQCHHARRQYGDETCQCVRGDGIDNAVARTLLEAMQPAQLEVSMAALEQIETRARQIDRQWQLRIERAQYEAGLARRRFCAVEPENRLVARTLEREWNDKLEEVQRLEHEYAHLPRPTERLASPEERQRILTLARDLPTVWHASTTTNAERKRLLRFLIQDVTLTMKETTIHIGIRWQTEALTRLDIPRPKKTYELYRTDPLVVELIRELSPSHTDRQLCAILNRKGLTTGTGKAFTSKRLKGVRSAYGIPLGCTDAPSQCPTGRRGDGRYSAQAAAQLLNVSNSTVLCWCKSGRLDGIQAQPGSPYWIRLTQENIAELRKPTKQHRSRHVSN